MAATPSNDVTTPKPYYEYKRARQMAGNHTTVYRKDRLHLRFKIIVFLERLYDPIISYSFYLNFF